MSWQPGLLGDTGPGRRGTAGLLRVLAAYRSPYALSVLFGVLNQGAGIAALTLGGYLVGLALTGAATSRLWPLALLTLALMVMQALANWLEAWISHELSFRLLAEVRYWLYRAFERIAPGGLVKRRTGDLAAVALRDAESLEIFYAHTSIYIAVALILPPVALAGLAVVAWPLALALTPWLLLVATVPFALRRRNAAHGRRVRDLHALVGTRTVDLVQGIREVLTFGRGEDARVGIAEASAELAEAQRRQTVRGGLEQAVCAALTGAGTVSVLAAAVWRGVEVPTLVAATVFATQSFTPLLTLLKVTRIWGLTSSSADRVFDLLEEPAVVADTGTRDAPATAGTVTFDGVWFRYGEHESWVLRGADLTIPAGSTVALVGATGAGKSTMANLLLRAFDPQRGVLRVDGVDIREYRLQALLRLVAYVPQDVFLLHDTLRENLVLAAPEASGAALDEVCAAAQLRPVLHRLPDGLDTVVGERGARLSGGERQRVALARALLRDAPILVLDESSSQLDVLSEREIGAALDRLRAGRTTLVIAHRLATIRTADLVALLEHGQIVDVAPHEVLLERCPSYAALIASQRDADALLAAVPSEQPSTSPEGR
ncbi:ABC transporter ATP-binding protein [Plantactinospora sp. WMMC1484]|uniref:ABC transporter ATP-binding protein n=1 Tax=Plantactinospora sp. WMMC1484 TaxID=3404122 RepID=UPI003BF603A6